MTKYTISLLFIFLFDTICIAQIKKEKINIGIDSYKIIYTHKLERSLAADYIGSFDKKFSFSNYKKTIDSVFSFKKIDDTLKYYYDIYLASFYKDYNSDWDWDSIKVYRNKKLVTKLKHDLYIHIINYENIKKIAYRYDISDYAFYEDINTIQKRRYEFDLSGKRKTIFFSKGNQSPYLIIYCFKNIIDSFSYRKPETGEKIDLQYNRFLKSEQQYYIIFNKDLSDEDRHLLFCLRYRPLFNIIKEENLKTPRCFEYCVIDYYMDKH